jgi:tetratricopeptide (TPR) repeat protein
MTRPGFAPALLSVAVLQGALLPAQTSRAQELEGLIAKGWALTTAGRFSEALAPLDRALSLEPDNPNALTWKGGALVGLKRPEQALPLLEKSLSARPDGAVAWRFKGQALFGAGRYKEAAACFERALALDPKDFAAKAALGWSASRAAKAPPPAPDPRSALVLDEVKPGSLVEWRERYDPRGMNPQFTVEEIASPAGGGKAIRTAARGTSFDTCETKWVRRVYATGPQRTEGTTVEAFLDFSFDGSEYNLPSVKIELLDERGQVIAGQVFFGKGVIGRFNRGQLAKSGHRELPSASGLQRFDLAAEFGAGRRFSALAVTLMNYACRGENSVVFDQLVLRSGGGR